MLDKLYCLGLDIDHWDVIKDLHNGVISTVKWQVYTSLSFSYLQGIRQDWIWSLHLYKQCINKLISELVAHKMGISIVNTYAGCPSCAVIIILLSNYKNKMQEMLNTDYDFASDHTFLIQPITSNTTVRSVNKRNAERIQQATTNFYFRW